MQLKGLKSATLSNLLLKLAPNNLTTLSLTETLHIDHCIKISRHFSNLTSVELSVRQSVSEPQLHALVMGGVFSKARSLLLHCVECCDIDALSSKNLKKSLETN